MGLENPVKDGITSLPLTNSPDWSGTRMFISEDFAETISALREFLLKYNMHPSVLSMLTVGTVFIT